MHIDTVHALIHVHTPVHTQTLCLMYNECYSFLTSYVFEMTRSDLNVGSSAMPIQTEGAKWIFNEDKVAQLSLQRLHNCKILSVIFLTFQLIFIFYFLKYSTEHFLCSVAMFTDIQPWAVRCPAGTHAHMPSEELSSTGESLHLRHLLLTVTDTSCHRTPAFFPCQPPRCLTDSLILHYILFCTSLFSHLPASHLSLCLFSCFHSSFLPHLIFMPASTSSPVMHCCRGHLLCPSLFMIPTFSTLAQKDTSMKYSPVQLAVKWFTQTCLSCVCDLYPLFSCLHWSYLICLLLSGTKHGIPAACYSMLLLVLVIYNSCWERTADAHLLHHFGLQRLP